MTCGIVGSLLLAQEVPPRVVMDVLGNSQFSITMDLYSHVMPLALREAAAAIDRALGSPDVGRLLSACCQRLNLSLGFDCHIALTR